MNRKLKHEIISIIEAPEMKRYLKQRADDLTIYAFADIIAGAPIALERKREFFLRLEKEPEGNLITGYVTFLNQVMEAVENMIPENTFLRVSPMGLNETKNRIIALAEPFYVMGLSEAQTSIQAYRMANKENSAKSFYWELKLFNFSKNEKHPGFCDSRFTYIATAIGEMQYIRCPRYHRYAQPFGAPVPELNLPVPYRQGDILHIDCRPYVPFDTYCLITEVGDYCGGVQCLFLYDENKFDVGALKQGRYFGNCYDIPQYLSPLYRAEVVNEIPRPYWILCNLGEWLMEFPYMGEEWRHGALTSYLKAPDEKWEYCSTHPMWYVLNSIVV